MDNYIKTSEKKPLEYKMHIDYLINEEKYKIVVELVKIDNSVV